MRPGPVGRIEESESSRTIARKKLPDLIEAQMAGQADLAARLLSDSPPVRMEALASARKRPLVLAELACSSPFGDLRLSSVAALEDGPALAEIASYSHFRDSRLAAARRLEGKEDMLAGVACDGMFGDARGMALSMMGDGGRAEVAIRSRKSGARKAALSMMSDPSALIQVAEECPYRSTREGAVRKLSRDREALCSLAVSSPRIEARRAAVAHLCPHLQEVGADVLVEIASLAPEEDYRLLALARMAADAPSLRRAMQKARHWGTRMTAIMLLSELVGEIDDANLLSEIAVLSPDRGSRAAAISKLSADPHSLAEVARRSRYSDTRDSALARISRDGASLRKVARSSAYHGTRGKAHRLACGREVLRRTLERLLG